jgi:hypothetical protein
MEKASRSVPAIAATIDSDRSAGFKGSFPTWHPDEFIKNGTLKTRRDTAQAMIFDPCKH